MHRRFAQLGSTEPADEPSSSACAATPVAIVSAPVVELSGEPDDSGGVEAGGAGPSGNAPGGAAPAAAAASEAMGRATATAMRMRVACAVGAWYCSSIGVTMLFKFLLSTRHFRAPFFLVGCTNVIVSALAAALSCTPCAGPRATVPRSTLLYVVLPIGIGSALDISFSNWSLSYVSVAYHVVLKGPPPARLQPGRHPCGHPRRPPAAQLL